MESWDLFGFAGVFVAAILGSLGHCVGMCGGIVLAYSGKFTQNGVTNKAQLLLYHSLYGLGRISVYVALGGIVGGLGSIFSVNATLSGVLFVIAGVAMILAGISLFGKLRFLSSLEYSLQNAKWYQTRFQNALHLKTPMSIFMLGILNGLLPCGFVYAFLFSAAGFASVGKGALVMLVFGLGTFPALFIFGLLANTLFYKQSLRKIMLNLAALSIIVFGGLMVQMGVKLLQNSQMGSKMHGMHTMTQDNNMSQVGDSNQSMHHRMQH